MSATWSDNCQSFLESFRNPIDHLDISLVPKMTSYCSLGFHSTHSNGNFVVEIRFVFPLWSCFEPYIWWYNESAAFVGMGFFPDAKFGADGWQTLRVGAPRWRNELEFKWDGSQPVWSDCWWWCCCCWSLAILALCCSTVPPLSSTRILLRFAIGQPDALLWDKNLPVACPDPSHPGIGHLSGSESWPSRGLLFGLLARGHPDKDLWEE